MANDSAMPTDALRTPIPVRSAHHCNWESAHQECKCAIAFHPIEAWAEIESTRKSDRSGSVIS
ncbi:hypothetical protein [Microseira sp. BLCC-F43]|uniref:hypothetical protein n=1 Tax=Microseira sp. BLCC-F43 TaxID=3153602 RepID=UPI0035B95DBC